MLKRFFAAGAALGLIVGFAGNAKADGFYVNPEFNSGWTEATFDGSILEGHVGYEKGSFYIQGGPAVTSDGTDGDWGFTAKPVSVLQLQKRLTCMAKFQLALSMTCPTPSKPV